MWWSAGGTADMRPTAYTGQWSLLLQKAALFRELLLVLLGFLCCKLLFKHQDIRVKGLLNQYPIRVEVQANVCHVCNLSIGFSISESQVHFWSVGRHVYVNEGWSGANIYTHHRLLD